MLVSNYTAKFNQLMMQVVLHPMEEVSYYLDSLRKEIRKAIEANPLNFGDIKALKLAALHQDHIENPQQHKSVVAEESAFTNDTTKHGTDRGKGKRLQLTKKKNSTPSNENMLKVQY